MFILIQVSKEAKMMPKTTHFFTLCCNIEKNANSHKGFWNIYKHHLIKFKYHNNSMFQYLLNAIFPSQFGNKLSILRQIVWIAYIVIGFTFCLIVNTESFLDVQ